MVALEYIAVPVFQYLSPLLLASSLFLQGIGTREAKEYVNYHILSVNWEIDFFSYKCPSTLHKCMSKKIFNYEIYRLLLDQV